VLALSKGTDLNWLVQGDQLYLAFPFSKGSLRRLQGLMAHIRLNWKGLTGTNTLVYCEHPEVAAAKSFTTLLPAWPLCFWSWCTTLSWSLISKRLKRSFLSRFLKVLAKLWDTSSTVPAFSCSPGVDVIKLFYCRNSQIFIISWSVCPWQAFPAWSNVCGKGREPTLKWSSWKVLHLERDRPYLQILD
jgi:hypothetical protein